MVSLSDQAHLYNASELQPFPASPPSTSSLDHFTFSNFTMPYHADRITEQAINCSVEDTPTERPEHTPRNKWTTHRVTYKADTVKGSPACDNPTLRRKGRRARNLPSPFQYYCDDDWSLDTGSTSASCNGPDETPSRSDETPSRLDETPAAELQMTGSISHAGINGSEMSRMFSRLSLSHSHSRSTETRVIAATREENAVAATEDAAVRSRSLLKRVVRVASCGVVAALTRKTGVFDMPMGTCDGALFALRGVLQRRFAGVVTAAVRHELRMLVLLQMHGNSAVLGVIVAADMRTAACCRLSVRKATSASQPVTNTEFDTFCAALGERLLQEHRVVRPHFAITDTTSGS